MWKHIKDEVAAIAPGQYPDEEDFYENSFYFNAVGSKTTAPKTTPTSNPNKYKNITIVSNVPGARVNIYGSTFDSGKPISFEKGRNYVFTIEVDGYQRYSGIIDVDKSPLTVNANLVKAQHADLYVSANKKADVYLDKQFVGQTIPGTPMLVETMSGRHDIKLTAKGYWDREETVELIPGKNSKEFKLIKDIPDFWDWDTFYETHAVTYLFSPKYQIGLSYMYRPENSRWSFGAILAGSAELLKPISFTSYSYSQPDQTITYTKDENGIPVTYRETTTGSALLPDKYSEEIDPFHEVKIKNSNALILGNAAFNICNGIQIEAGLGAGYHKDIYHMPYVAIKETTTVTNVATGATVGEPQISYRKEKATLTYKGDPKWSPAARLGARFFIPLDGWDSRFITLGAGYTFLFSNSKQSSWDVNIGYLWSF